MLVAVRGPAGSDDDGDLDVQVSDLGLSIFLALSQIVSTVLSTCRQSFHLLQADLLSLIFIYYRLSFPFFIGVALRDVDL